MFVLRWVNLVEVYYFSCCLLDMIVGSLSQGQAETTIEDHPCYCFKILYAAQMSTYYNVFL